MMEISARMISVNLELDVFPPITCAKITTCAMITLANLVLGVLPTQLTALKFLESLLALFA
jgi:hypothetical protein